MMRGGHHVCHIAASPSTEVLGLLITREKNLEKVNLTAGTTEFK